MGNNENEFPNSIIDLIKDQMIHIRKNYLLHYYVGDHLERIEKHCLGIPAIFLSIVATTTGGFSLLQSPYPPYWLSIISVLSSMAVSILTSLITFLNTKDKVLQNHQAAANYYNLLSECKAFLAYPNANQYSSEILTKKEQEIIDKIHRLHRDSPSIPGWAYSKADALIGNYRKFSRSFTEQQLEILMF